MKKIALRAQQFQASERFQHLRLNEASAHRRLAQEMLKEALNAFARLDVIAAGEVIGRDAASTMFERIMRLLVLDMMEDPRTISAGLEVAFLAKAIERVADHAKNISEYGSNIEQGRTLGTPGSEPKRPLRLVMAMENPDAAHASDEPILVTNWRIVGGAPPRHIGASQQKFQTVRRQAAHFPRDALT